MSMTNRTGASSDALLDRMAEALRAAREFIGNGIEYGYITMPRGGDDPAHKTPGLIDAALAAYVDRLRAQSSVTTEKPRYVEFRNGSAHVDLQRVVEDGIYPKASPEVAAAPVAWQYRRFDAEEQAWSDYWHQCTEEQAKMMRDPRHASGYEVRDLYTAQPQASGVAAAAVASMPYLCGGTRFKLHSTKSGAGFTAFPSELIGRWVALVDATDGKHMTAQPQPRAESQPVTDAQP